MTLAEAITNLGFDANRYFYRMSALSRQDKIAAAEQFMKVAKKRARGLMIEHHPDKGGDHDKFVKISAAVDVLEKETAKFVDAIKLKILEEESKLTSRIVIERF
jgi:hypothetical protein